MAGLGGGRWRFRGSVFDAFTGAEREGVGRRPRSARSSSPSAPIEDFGFPLLIERLLELLPPDAEVLWQTGDTDVSGFPIEGHHAIPEKELTAAMADADLVVAHAGVGASLAAFEVGKCPVLVPRRLSAERAHRRPPDPDRGRARRSRRRGRNRGRRAGFQGSAARSRNGGTTSFGSAASGNRRLTKSARDCEAFGRSTSSFPGRHRRGRAAEQGCDGVAAVPSVRYALARGE